MWRARACATSSERCQALAGAMKLWNKAEIGYWPFYAFEEVLAVFGDRFRTNSSLLAACEHVAGLVTDGKVNRLTRQRLRKESRSSQPAAHQSAKMRGRLIIRITRNARQSSAGRNGPGQLNGGYAGFSATTSRTKRWQSGSKPRPSDFGLGVDTKFQQKYRIWVDRTPDRIFVIYARCTHLGCTPDWKPSENKFKCPCHGSGYDSEGINFEGPAPRPMDRARLEVAPDGQILVDVSHLYQWPKGQPSQFNDDGAFLPA